MLSNGDDDSSLGALKRNGDFVAVHASQKVRVARQGMRVDRADLVGLQGEPFQLLEAGEGPSADPVDLEGLESQRDQARQDGQLSDDGLDVQLGIGGRSAWGQSAAERQVREKRQLLEDAHVYI